MTAPSYPAPRNTPSQPVRGDAAPSQMTAFESALLAVLGRIAGSLEAQAAAQAAGPDRPAPNLRRPFDAYAGFDWTSIGASVLAGDQFGATEVEWGERMFKRYRSAEDDDKGQDIRFRRVKAGTVADHNLEWETLIKFADNKPAKPLRGELAERIRDAAGRAQAQAPAAAPRTPPAAPSQPAPRGQGAQQNTPSQGAPAAAAPRSAPSQPVRGETTPSQGASPRGNEGETPHAPAEQGGLPLLARGVSDDATIRAALAAGATLQDLAAAVNGSNGPTLFWCAARYWFVPRPAVDDVLADYTDANRKTNWAGAILALAPNLVHV